MQNAQVFHPAVRDGPSNPEVLREIEDSKVGAMHIIYLSVSSSTYPPVLALVEKDKARTFIPEMEAPIGVARAGNGSEVDGRRGGFCSDISMRQLSCITTTWWDGLDAGAAKRDKYNRRKWRKHPE